MDITTPTLVRCVVWIAALLRILHTLQQEGHTRWYVGVSCPVANSAMEGTAGVPPLLRYLPQAPSVPDFSPTGVENSTPSSHNSHSL
jgi:hypothetical protein